MKRAQKKRIIKKHSTHQSDTGSPQVQIAILSERIKQLTDHLSSHGKDDSSRKGLLGLVGQRRKLLNYLKSRDPESYDGLVKKLKLRAK